MSILILTFEYTHLHIRVYSYLRTSILKRINEYTHIISDPRPLVTNPPTRHITPTGKRRIASFSALRTVASASFCHLSQVCRRGCSHQNTTYTGDVIARCDTWTLHPAIAELRKVRRDNFAPCDSLMLHLATSRYRTLPLSRVAPCDSKPPLSTLKSRPTATTPFILYKERAREDHDSPTPSKRQANSKYGIIRSSREAGATSAARRGAGS